MNKRFIEFGGNYININNIETTYITNDAINNNYSIFIKTITNNKYGEYYDTKTERNKRFNEIINILN